MFSWEDTRIYFCNSKDYSVYLQANKEYEKAAMKECTVSGKAQKATVGNLRFLPFSPPLKDVLQWFTDNWHLCTLKTKALSNFSYFLICRRQTLVSKKKKK